MYIYTSTFQKSSIHRKPLLPNLYMGRFVANYMTYFEAVVFASMREKAFKLQLPTLLGAE